jgi:hypothetical protein
MSGAGLLALTVIPLFPIILPLIACALGTIYFAFSLAGANGAFPVHTTLIMTTVMLTPALACYCIGALIAKHLGRFPPRYAGWLALMAGGALSLYDGKSVIDALSFTLSGSAGAGIALSVTLFSNVLTIAATVGLSVLSIVLASEVPLHLFGAAIGVRGEIFRILRPLLILLVVGLLLDPIGSYITRHLMSN